MAAFGLEEEAPPSGPQVFHLLPEHLETFELWLSLQTQWRAGMAGATGLDYAAVESALRMNGVPRRRHRELLALIQAMEAVTLREWAERAERNKPTKPSG